MKPKRPRLAKFKSRPSDASQPDVPPPAPRKDWSYITGQWLDEVAAGTEKGIRDTYAWKESVRKFGLQETRKMLKLGLLSRKLPDHNPMN